MRNQNNYGVLLQREYNRRVCAMERLTHFLDSTIGGLSVLLLWLIPAALGRGVWYADAVRKGERKLALGLIGIEAGTAIFCAIVGGGLADYLQLSPRSGWALIGVVSWLGPNGAYALAMLILQRRPGGKGRE